MTAPKFRIGDHVASWNSGLAYIVLAVHPLNGSFVYGVRRLRGGVEWGPYRNIAECRLIHDKGVEEQS